MVENVVKEYRERAGLSQSELARRVRVASPNISAIEAGRITAWPRLRKAIAKALKVSESVLFPGSNSNGQTCG